MIINKNSKFCDNLTFYITNEVEKNISRDLIQKFFQLNQ